MMRKRKNDVNIAYSQNYFPNSIHIPKIPTSISESDLRTYLENYGEIRYFTFHQGKSWSNASIIYKNSNGYKNFMNRDKPKLNGVPITSKALTSRTTVKNLIGKFGQNKIVFIHQIPHKIDQRTLLGVFNRFGKVQEVNIFPSQQDELRYGYVSFWNELMGFRLIAQGRIEVSGGQSSNPQFIYVEKYVKGTKTDPWFLESELKKNTSRNSLEEIREDGGEEEEGEEGGENSSKGRYVPNNLDSLEMAISGLNQLLPFMGYKDDKLASLKYDEIMKAFNVFLIQRLLKEIGYFETKGYDTFNAVKKKLAFKGDFDILQRVANNHIPSNVRYNYKGSS